MDTSKMVFVFGSNVGGIHGSGAALYAVKEKGAEFGRGYGHVGNSFAIPTKGIKRVWEFCNTYRNYVGDTLSLTTIQTFVDPFITYAGQRPDLDFQITCIGCGLAGLKHEEIAPMFRDAPISNCYFDLLWMPFLGSGRKYWGTY
jgi:hypothetical protein